MTLYGSKHLNLANTFVRTFKVLASNYDCKIPSSARAIKDHQQALLNLRRFLDSIGAVMPKPIRKVA